AAAEAAGGDVVLVKPCLPERLAEEIRRVLRESHRLRDRAALIRDRIQHEGSRSEGPLERSHADIPRGAPSRLDARRETTEAPPRPPLLLCPICNQPMMFVTSHIGGVNANHSEQWDDFECAKGCGKFEFRHRTRKIRRVS